MEGLQLVEGAILGDILPSLRILSGVALPFGFDHLSLKLRPSFNEHWAKSLMYEFFDSHTLTEEINYTKTSLIIESCHVETMR